jgi:NAD(P)-dependent dehydrogenase (short-subunit alcohol dehydrogenase family)
MNGGLSGTTVLVTGAGQGLGAEICHSLAAAGARIIACDINEQAAQDVAAAVQKAGGEAEALAVDVTNEHAVAGTVQAALNTAGRIHALVNNAGTDVTKPLEDISIAEWDRVIDTNLRGAFLLSRALYPHFIKRRGGHIINIASTAAKRTWTEASAYHASKWGLLGFSHALHAEARRHNIKVTAVISGGMRTPFILERFPDTDPATLQDPKNVADTVRYVLTQPAESVIPEIMVLPMKETSWP